MNEQVIKLLQILIVCATIVFIAIKYQPTINPDSENMTLEKEKMQYELQINRLLFKVDSLEMCIKSLEEKKKENITASVKRKKGFRDLKPNEQVISFNELFNSLASDEQR